MAKVAEPAAPAAMREAPQAAPLPGMMPPAQAAPPSSQKFTGNPVSLDFQGADLRAVLRTFADGRLELTPLGDMEIPHNHSIQVWAFPDPNGAPVSVGVVQTARTVLLNPQNLPQPHSNQLFAISVEPLSEMPPARATTRSAPATSRVSSHSKESRSCAARAGSS